MEEAASESKTCEWGSGRESISHKDDKEQGNKEQYEM